MLNRAFNVVVSRLKFIEQQSLFLGAKHVAINFSDYITRYL